MRFFLLAVFLSLTYTARPQSPFNHLGKRETPESAAVFKGVKPDETVSVRILARKLDASVGDIPLGGAAKILSDDAVHYHAIVVNSKGQIIDNFGWSNEEGVSGHVFSEQKSRFSKDYDSAPKAEALLSYKDYLLVKNQFLYNERKSGYSLTNNGLTDYHNPEYSGGRENFNCQFAMFRFWQELTKTGTFEETTPFTWPNGNADSLTSAKETVDETVSKGIERVKELVSNPTPSSTINVDTFISPGSAQVSQTPSGIVNTAPAFQTQTIDNTAMKAQFSSLLENVYQQTSGLAASEGVGAEYQAAVAPVLERGRAAIAAIPDQQTVTVPAGSAQGGGYSSEIMDQFGKTFAEQGPCAAGLQLEALKNQNRNR